MPALAARAARAVTALPCPRASRSSRSRPGPDAPRAPCSEAGVAGGPGGQGGDRVALYEQALADFVRVLGQDHPQTLASRNNLAYAYQDAGDLGRAIPL